MGSSYFGEPNFGSERGGSSRKSKKSNSDKPKQPQRGLGVAQLEKIRLNGQMGCNYHPSLHSPYPTHFSQDDMRVQTAAYPVTSPPFSYSTSSSAAPASYGLHPGAMMGIGDYERTNSRYSDSLHSAASSWHPGSSMFETQHFAQSSSTRHLLNLQLEDTLQKPTSKKKQRSDSMGSDSQNSESNDTQELDLELRLSL